MLLFMIGYLIQNNTKYTLCFGEEGTHVRHNVLARVQQLAVVSRSMLLQFGAEIMIVLNHTCCYLLAMRLWYLFDNLVEDQIKY